MGDECDFSCDVSPNVETHCEPPPTHECHHLESTHDHHFGYSQDDYGVHHNYVFASGGGEYLSLKCINRVLCGMCVLFAIIVFVGLAILLSHA
ncbi:hypothetical protein MTP99_018129 [Tenebrio molitor]|jgi:hypothetical protein|nr:hypothetical protein MTP99_018123 [Tenebrio molitor]KAJ3624513.1 hypothetical protein MTP99_018129 [Tenebrio molitor]CAH1376714.1 unnamed protein product [Tenebrio molitor]